MLIEDFKTMAPLYIEKKESSFERSALAYQSITLTKHSDLSRKKTNSKVKLLFYQVFLHSCVTKVGIVYISTSDISIAEEDFCRKGEKNILTGHKVKNCMCIN